MRRLRIDIKREYEAQFRKYKLRDPARYKWEMSNSRYIKWLENNYEHHPPSTIYVIYFHNIYNLSSQPILRAYKTKRMAYIALRNILLRKYKKWFNNRVVHGKVRGEKCDFTNLYKIIELRTTHR